METYINHSEEQSQIKETYTSDPLEGFKNHLRVQAERPPGNDPTIGSCYGETLAILEDESEDINALTRKNRLSSILAATFVARDMTEEHLANLYFRCMQYLQVTYFNRPRSIYPAQYTRDTNLWKLDIEHILDQAPLNNPFMDELNSDTPREHSPLEVLFYKLLLERDTTTTQYQRYLGPLTLIANFFPNGNARVADFGCSTNEGLSGIARLDPFETKNLKDRTGLVEAFLKNRYGKGQPIIAEGWGLDQYDPKNEEHMLWTYLCRYPKEIASGPDFETWRAARLEETPNVHFLQMDLAKPRNGEIMGKTGGNPFDVAIAATMLYQMRTEEQVITIDNLKHNVHPETGLVLVQDFLKLDPSSPSGIHTKGINWTGPDFPYRLIYACKETGWDFREAMCYSNGRCMEMAVCNTEHFNELQNIIAQRKANQE